MSALRLSAGSPSAAAPASPVALAQGEIFEDDEEVEALGRMMPPSRPTQKRVTGRTDVTFRE